MSGIKYRRDIDGLRAIAVMSVCLFHFHVMQFDGGFIGVDIFFVISGYLISGNIKSELAEDRFSILNFYFKRAKRILPSLIATLILTTLVAVVVLLPQDLNNYGRSLIATAVFLSNVFFLKDSGYFSPASDTKPLLHTWSLSLEEQYYIFIPVLLWLIYSRGRERWQLWLVPLTALSLIMSILAVFHAPTAGFYLLPTRAWELLMGALLALTPPPAVSGWRREAVSLTGAGLLITGLVTLNEYTPFPGWNALWPCVGTVFIIYGGAVDTEGRAPCINRILSAKPFVWIGLISYSLYLVHWPVAAFVRYRTLRDPTSLEGLAMLGGSLVLAYILWRFVEQPFRHIKRERLISTLAASVAGLALCSAAGATLIVNRGFPGRYPDAPQLVEHVRDADDANICFNQDPVTPVTWRAKQCQITHGSGGNSLLWGDSYAAQYVTGLTGTPASKNVYQYTFAGCPPLLSFNSYKIPGCKKFNSHALEIIRDQKIDTVVMAARWTNFPRDRLSKISDTIEVLRRQGVKVVVIGQSPQFETDVKRIDYISGLSKLATNPRWRISFDPSLNELLKKEAQGATFIDPLAYLCPSGECQYRAGSEYLYQDYGHYSPEGSRRAVQAYFPTQ